jgi:MoaD family protein
MKVTITYFGQLRHVVGVESEAGEYADALPLTTVLAGLADRYGEAFRTIVFDDQGGLRASLMVLVNGVAVAKGMAPALRDGDVVTLLPAIAGG